MVPTLKELQALLSKSLDKSMDEKSFTEWLATEHELAEKLTDAAAKQAKMAYLYETSMTAAKAFEAGKRFELPAESDSVSAIKTAAKAQIANATATPAAKAEAETPAAATTKLTEPAPEAIGKQFRKIPDNATEDAVFGNVAGRGVKLRSDGIHTYVG